MIRNDFAKCIKTNAFHGPDPPKTTVKEVIFFFVETKMFS